MTYFNKTTIKEDLGITSTTYDNQIDDVWGPEADDEIEIAAKPYLTIPITANPYLETATRLANLRVKARYFEFTHQEELQKDRNAQFEKGLERWITSLEASSTAEDVPQLFLKTTGNVNQLSD